MEEDEEEAEISVYLEKVKVENPKISTAGCVSYTLSGYDKVGQYNNIEKRYRDFYVLHEWLTQRYQGLYIPEIPQKKAIGNREFKFIEERRFLLQEFLMNLTKHKYLWTSDEYTAWVRTSSAQDLVANLKDKTRRQLKA